MSEHKWKSMRYHDFVSISCEVCDTHPHGRFVKLACEEELARKVEFEAARKEWGRRRDEALRPIQMKFDEEWDTIAAKLCEKWDLVCKSKE